MKFFVEWTQESAARLNGQPRRRHQLESPICQAGREDGVAGENNRWSFFGLLRGPPGLSSAVENRDDSSEEREISEQFLNADSESGALGLASTARGGGGRGWWFPGQRARRRRNLARATARAAAKRATAERKGGLPTGLANQGNTCYLNSLLQTMYHAPGLRKAVLEAVQEGECGDGVTVAALAKVFQNLDEGNR